MFHKLNYDYDVLLSDENESVSSTSSSDNDESSRKFILGNNLLDFNSLEIISVRQKNKNVEIAENNIRDISCKSTNIHFDESFSDIEDEEISEIVENTDNVINFGSSFSSSTLKYELPKVSRFQTFLIEENKEKSSSMKEVADYCIKERGRRNKNKMEKSVTGKDQHTLNAREKYRPSDSGNHIQATKPEPPQEPIACNIDLSELPVDVLTEFINSDKPLEEIVSKSKKKYKGNNKNTKKSKKHNIKKVKVIPSKPQLIEPQNERNSFSEITDTNTSKTSLTLLENITNTFIANDIPEKSPIIPSVLSLDFDWTVDNELITLNLETSIFNQSNCNSNNNVISQSEIPDDLGLSICNETIMTNNEPAILENNAALLPTLSKLPSDIKSNLYNQSDKSEISNYTQTMLPSHVIVSSMSTSSFDSDISIIDHSVNIDNHKTSDDHSTDPPSCSQSLGQLHSKSTLKNKHIVMKPSKAEDSREGDHNDHSGPGDKTKPIFASNKNPSVKLSSKSKDANTATTSGDQGDSMSMPAAVKTLVATAFNKISHYRFLSSDPSPQSPPSDNQDSPLTVLPTDDRQAKEASLTIHNDDNESKESIDSGFQDGFPGEDNSLMEEQIGTCTVIKEMEHKIEEETVSVDSKEGKSNIPIAASFPRNECLSSLLLATDRGNPFKRDYHSADSVVHTGDEIIAFLKFQWLMFCESHTLRNLV